MNAREAKKRREAELLAIVNAQKGVIGAIVRQLDLVKKDVDAMKIQVATLESREMTIQ